MSAPNYTVSMVAYPLLPGQPAPVGACLVLVDGQYQISTLAARGVDYLKSSGIVTSAGAVNSGVFMQSFGDIPASISGLGPGLNTYVRVGDTGYLERRPSISPIDDIVGWCEPDGTCHLFFGGVYNTTGGGGSGDAVSIQLVPVDPTAPTPTQALVFDGTYWTPGGADAKTIQGISVAITAPTTGDALVFDGFGWGPAPGGSGDATSIQGTPVDPATPNEGDVLVCDGGIWTPGFAPSDADKIQGVPVSATPPNINDTLVYNGFTYVPAPGGGGGSGNATSIQSNAVSPGTITAAKSVYIWNGSALVARPLTQSDIGPDFSVSLSGGVTREVGQAASGLTFTASYTGGTPTSATLTNNNGDPAFVVPNPYTSASPPWSITKTANNALVVVTITAQPGSVSDTVNLSWQPRVFYGVAVPGAITEAFIEALASQPLASGKARTVAYNAGVAEKCYYAVPSSYGVPSGTVSGFPFGATNVGTVSITNGFGDTQNYVVMESNLAGLGAITVVWS